MPVDENLMQFYSESDSWMEVPEFTTEDELIYLDSLEHVWKVKSGNSWVDYKLAPHQVLWHKDDVILKKELAPIRVVIKSRNTSFTISSLISLLTSISEYKNDVIPLTRLNSQKAIDMIFTAKQLIKHMTPLVFYETDKHGNQHKIYWPFNPDNVDISNSKSIRFLDDNGDVVTEIRAFPANADAAETIRGIRTIGHCGILDETNFMRTFKSLFIALRDSSVGKINGKKIQQIDIGTTLKGETPFTDWYEDQVKKQPKNIKFYEWPVFDRKHFNTEIPFNENDDLVSIVEWHDKEELWDLYIQDENVFLEEYMAQKVDSDLQFYSTALLLACHTLDTTPLDEIDFANYDKITVGIDPASTKDYFAISVFGWYNNGNNKKEIYLDYENKIDLPESKQKCRGILNAIKKHNSNWLCTIDATPIGLDLYQTLRNEYGNEYIRGVTGNKRVTVNKDTKVKLNEYGHTEMKRMMNDGEVEFILDDMAIKHFQSITYKYAPDRDGNGHGDICLARLYSLLPNNLNSVVKKTLKSNILENQEDDDDNSGGEDLFSKVKRYRRTRKRNRSI